MDVPGVSRSAPVAVVRPISEMLIWVLVVILAVVVFAVSIYAVWTVVETVYFHFRQVQMKLMMQVEQIYVGDPITVGVKAQRSLRDEFVRLRRLTDDGRGPAVDPAQTYEQSLGIQEDDSRLIFPELPLPGQYELLYYSADRKHVLKRLKFVARRPDLNAELLQLMWLDPIKINFTASPIRNSADTIILLRDDADGLEKGEYLPVVAAAGTAQGSAVFSGNARLPGTYTAFYVRSRMTDKKEKGMVLARSCTITVTGPTVSPYLAWPERCVAGMYKDPLRVDFETGINRCKSDTIVLHKGLWSDPEGRMTLESGSTNIVASLSVPTDALVSTVTFSDVRAPPAPGEYCTLYINAKRVMACSRGFWIHPPIVTALRLPLYYCNPDVPAAALTSASESIDASRAAKVPVTPWRTPLQFAVLLSKNRSPRDALFLCRRDEKPGTQCTSACVRELTGVNAYMSAVARPSDEDWQYRPETAALGPISAHCGEIFIVKFDALYSPRLPGIYSVVYVPEGNVKIVPSLRVSLENLDLVVDPSCQHPDLVKFGSQGTGLTGARSKAQSSAGYWPWQIFSSGPSASAQWYAWGNVFAACGARVSARHPSKLVDSASQPLESSELHYTSPIVFDPVTVQFQTVRNPDPAAPQDRIALVPAGHPVNSSSAFLLPASAGQINQHILLDPSDLSNRADIIESRLFVEQVQCDQAPQLPGMYQFVYLAAADANTPPLPAGAPVSILAASTQHDCLRLYASRPEAMPGYIEIGRSQSFPVRPPDLLVKDATEYPPVAENAPSGVTPAISYNTWLRAYLFGNVDVKPEPPKPKVKVWVYTSANHIDGDYIAIARAGGDPEDLNGGKLKIKIPRGCATHPLVFSSESDMLPRESGRYEAVYIRGSTSSRWFGSAAEERVVFIPASAYQNPALFSHMKSAAVSYTRSGAAILCRSEPFCIDVSAVNNLTVGVAEQSRYVSSEGGDAVIRPVAQPHVPKLYPSLAHMPPGSTFTKAESGRIAMLVAVPQWRAPPSTVRASAPSIDDDLCSFCRIAVPTKPCSICHQSFCNSCDAKNHPAHRVPAPDVRAAPLQRAESSSGSRAAPTRAEAAAGSTPSRAMVERQVNVDDFAQRNSRRGGAIAATSAGAARDASTPSTPLAPHVASIAGTTTNASKSPSAPPGVSPSMGGVESVTTDRPQRSAQVAAPLSLFADITSRNFALSPVAGATKATASAAAAVEPSDDSSVPAAGEGQSNPELAQYEKMLKVGIAIEGVKRKMESNQAPRELIELFCRMHGAEELCSPLPKAAAPRIKTSAKPAAVPVEVRPPRAAAPSLMDALKAKASAAAERRAGKPYEDPRKQKPVTSPTAHPLSTAMNGVLANRMARRRTHVDKGRRSDGSESDSGFEFDAPARR
jgi:hypothetical protein